MYFMGMFEFKRYMDAADTLEELKQEQDAVIQGAYEDIHPTRVHYDYEQGKMFSESLNVADYAIWLIEKKESHSRHREFWERRATTFDSVKNVLSEEEKILLEEVKSSDPSIGMEHRKVIEKLKKHLERAISNRSHREALVDLSTIPNDVEEWDRKVEAMSEAELFEDYWDQEEAAL